MTTNLSSRAMLARLTITSWSARKIDKRVTHDATTREGAKDDSGRFNKRLLAGVDGALKEIGTIASAARAAHYRLTLPWTDDGARCLTNAGFYDYAATMADLERQYYAAVDDKFLPSYPDAVSSARFALGSMYDPNDYPSAARVRAKFRFSTAIDPMPNSDDFRANLSDDAITAIRADIEHRLQQATAEAMRDLWRQLFEPIRHMAEALPKYSNGEAKRFNDSLVDNLTGMIDRLPLLNLTNDPQLTALADQARAQLCACSPQTLRDDTHARQQTASAAAAMVRQMSAIMGEPAPALPEPPRPTVEAQILDLFSPRCAA